MDNLVLISKLWEIPNWKCLNFVVTGGKRIHLPSFLDNLSNGLYSCRFCDDFCDHLDVAQDHIKIHFEVRAFLQKIGGGNYKCLQCDQPPNNFANSKSHVESKHFSPGYSCAYCGRAYAVEKALKRHMKKCKDWNLWYVETYWWKSMLLEK